MSDVPSNLIPTRITQLPTAPVASEDSLMMIVYNGNNYQIRVGDLLSVAGVPTTRQVIAGTSLTGGGQLSSNVTLSVATGGITSTQLSATGVAAGSYGDATNIPVFTVDSTGRVTAASTIAATISGYVPTTRQVIAGTGLTGGGPLNANVTLAADLSDSLPLAGLTTGSAGVATSMSRSDHKHPQVDLSSANEVENILGLSHGGTAKSIVPMAGAVVWSGADGLYVSPAGTAGQVLVSGGSSTPTWGTAIILSDQPANVVYAGPASGSTAPAAFRALVNDDLPASSVTANTYGSSTTVPVITVNSKGVVTSVTTSSIIGTLSYQGGWNASTNVPALTSSVGTSGYYYVVTTAGSTNLNGITDWAIGDWAIFNGTVWQKIDQTNTVTSVNGQTGAVSVGTVTSVAMTVPTGLSISGTPITTSGTLALTLAAGYSIPTTANQTNWTTAYTQTQQWNGGSTNLVSATGRTSLGGTTVGQSMFTLTNPSAITFPRFNADNTVSALDAASFRTAIGAGTSSTTGTVTSVGGTGTVNGITLTGTVTSTGNLTLGGTLSGVSLTTQVSGTLPVLNGGTGVTTSTGTGNVVLSTSPTLTTPILGTPASGTLTNCTGYTYANLSGTVPTWNQNTTGTAANVTGIVAVANGGTGATTLTGVLKGNGASAFTAATSGTDFSAGTSALTTGILKSTTTTGALTIAVAADFPTLNQNTTGTAAGLSSILTIASGGTNSSATPTAGGAGYGTGTAHAYTAAGTVGQVLTSQGASAPTWTTVASSGGTVTSVSVTSANGFAGTVATATTTPAITLTTSITGVLKGNGTAISAAVAGTDYQSAQSVTGMVKSSGTTRSAATSGTDYSAGTSALVTGILKSTTTTGALTIAVAGDFPTLNQNTTGTAAGLSATLAIASGGTNSTATPTAGGAGYGTGTAHAYTAAGTVGQVLTSQGASAPTWTTVASSGGTVTSVSVTSANGFAGTVATATTTPAITLTTSITGVLKGNGTAISAAVAGTDYQSAQSVTGMVKSSGTTRSAATSGTDYSAGTSALVTGILKSTTTTGALTIAVAGDFPTLNQNTTGTAAGLSATLAIASGGTNSTATPTAGGAGYGTGTAHAYTAAGTAGQVLTSAGASAPTWSGINGGTF